MRVWRSYKYRAYPTTEQEERLLRWCDALRFVWNAALAQRLHRREQYQHGAAIGPVMYLEQQNQLRPARAEAPWLADVPIQCACAILRDLDLAWQAWQKTPDRVHRPKQKRRRTKLTLLARAPNVALAGSFAKFPKIGPLALVVHRPLEGEVKLARITRDVDQWYISFLCAIEIADPTQPTGGTVGIDRGVAVTLADSTGRLACLPSGVRRLEERASTLQRSLLKHKTCGSSNWQAAWRRIAGLRRRARRLRTEWLHKQATHYAQSYAVVKIEALKIKSMTASAKGTLDQPGTHVAAKAGLNRAILLQGWAQFVRLLKYKCEATGAVVIEVPPQYTSQRCSSCGHVDDTSRQSQSRFVCTSCGLAINADTNAARNIAAADGRAVGGYGVKCSPRNSRHILRRIKGTMSSSAKPQEAGP